MSIYIYICFNLLEQILGDLYDFEILKELKNNQSLQASDLSYQSALKVKILEENYQEALNELYEIKRSGHTLDTDILFILIKSVMRKKKIPFSFNSDNVENLESYFTQFEKALKDENYEEAKENIQKYCNINAENKILYNEELLILVEGLIDLQGNKIDFNEDKGIVYEGSHEEILIKAIHNRDFKVAFSKIGACTYKTTNTSYLLMKNILYKMFAYKNKDKKIEPKEAIKENPIKESLISVLYPYIMAGDFNKAQEIVTNSEEESRLKDLCIALFEELAIVKNRYKYYNRVTLKGANLYSQVFEAIRRHDLQQARELLLKVIPRANSKQELEIYLQLVNEILSQNQFMPQMQESEEKLKHFFSNSVYLSIDDVLSVKELLEERIELFGPSKRDYHLLNIIDVIISANEISISKNDFSSIPSKKENPLNRLNEYLDNGEYILAEELIDKTSDWKVFASEYSVFDIKMIKYLLKTMKLFMYKYTEKERETSELPKMSDEFYSLVKHRKYKEALQFYLVYGDVLYETENKDLIKNLIVPFYLQSEEGIKLYEEYLNAKEQSNRDLERIALLNYKEYLRINNIDDNYVPVLKK